MGEIWTKVECRAVLLVPIWMEFGDAGDERGIVDKGWRRIPPQGGLYELGCTERGRRI